MKTRQKLSFLFLFLSLTTCFLTMQTCGCVDDNGHGNLDETDDDQVYDDDTADADDDVTLDPGLSWVVIPAGSFGMGCSPGDDLCNPDEKPLHTVEISSFQITATEITQDDYQQVTGKNPSFFQPENDHAACPNCPVEDVTWVEAEEFCRLVGGRLPSEAEWEYAARAGTTTRTYCGDDLSCLDDIAWYSDNAGEQTHAVATKQPNDFDLYDMIGNVWEWVYDWYDSSYYDNSPLNDPPGSEGGSFRVLRGGGWIYDTDTQWTVSDRFLQEPERKFAYVGFRCVRD